MTGSLAELTSTRRVLVTCGAGGVGKTTMAAALGLAAALGGRRVAVVTIDPARRLADALGLDSLANQPQRVDLDTVRNPTADGPTGGRRSTQPRPRPPPPHQANSGPSCSMHGPPSTT